MKTVLTAVLFASFAVSAHAAPLSVSVPVTGGIPALPTGGCHPVQHAAFGAPDAATCCGMSMLCPRPLGLTVVRTRKHADRT